MPNFPSVSPSRMLNTWVEPAPLVLDRLRVEKVHILQLLSFSKLRGHGQRVKRPRILKSAHRNMASKSPKIWDNLYHQRLPLREPAIQGHVVITQPYVYSGNLNLAPTMGEALCQCWDYCCELDRPAPDEVEFILQLGK